MATLAHILTEDITREILDQFVVDHCAEYVAQHPEKFTTSPAASVVDELAVPSWDDYKGQAKVRTELLVRIRSAVKRGRPMPHVLLVAGPGTGKTTIARLIAAELDKRLVEISRPPKDPDAFIDQLWGFHDGVLFIDEVHTWPKGNAQHMLMGLLEAGVIEGRMGPMRFPELTVVCATTEEDRLFLPLLSRFSCRPDFVDYTDDEMTEIVAGMLGRAGVDLDETVVAALGRASAGNPRTARHIAEAARDLNETGMPTDSTTILGFAGVAEDGLTREHLAYLDALANCPNGRAGIPTLATLLGKAHEQIRRIERVLTKRRLVVIGAASGRQITPAGRDRLIGMRAG